MGVRVEEGSANRETAGGVAHFRVPGPISHVPRSSHLPFTLYHFPVPRMRVIPSLALTVLIVTSCRDPRADANVAQAMMEAGAQITMLQQDQSIMQSQLDSLLQVVAWQDTVIRRLASHTGLPMASR